MKHGLGRIHEYNSVGNSGEHTDRGKRRLLCRRHDLHARPDYCTTQPPQQAYLNERLIFTGPSVVTLSGTACVKCLMQMELTQWRSLFCVCRSPKKTWPRCEPHPLHMISMPPMSARTPTWHWSPV